MPCAVALFTGVPPCFRIWNSQNSSFPLVSFKALTDSSRVGFCSWKETVIDHLQVQWELAEFVTWMHGRGRRVATSRYGLSKPSSGFLREIMAAIFFESCKGYNSCCCCWLLHCLWVEEQFKTATTEGPNRKQDMPKGASSPSSPSFTHQ